MICVFTRAYHGIYYEHTGSRVVRVINLDGTTKILCEKTDWIWGEAKYGIGQTCPLAFYILKDAFGDAIANNIWNRFANDVVAKLPAKTNWIITKESIADLYAAEIVLATLGEMGGKR
jgi:hypothetical protein